MVMTRGQAKAAGAVAPEVHGVNKPLDPDKKPEKDTILQKQIIPANISAGSNLGPTAIPNKPMAPPPVQLPVKVIPPTLRTPQKIQKQNIHRTPQINKGYLTPQTIPGLSASGRSPGMLSSRNVVSQLPNKVMRTPIPGSTSTNIPQTVHSTPISSTTGYTPVRKQLNFDMPNLDLDSYGGDTYVPTPVGDIVPTQTEFRPSIIPQPKQITNVRGDPSLDPDRELPLEESSVECIFRAPVLQDFIIPPTLEEETRGKEVLAKNLPKQTDIDRLMKVLNRKILTRSRFPDTLKDLEAAYVQSAYFKDVYEYLRYNKLPNNVRKAYQVQIDANNYFLLGILLFKFHPSKTGETVPVLCVPPSKMDMVLDHYHSSLLGGHQGMNKTLRTLQERFFCPRMGDLVRSYIVSCHVCQLFKNSKRFDRPFLQRKYDINQGTMTCISMDIKHMPKSSSGYKYILVMLCEISNFMVTAPIVTATSPEICKAIQDNLICVFGTPVKLICDQDPAFMSHMTQQMLISYGVKLITVSPTNHRSLLAEHGIKSLSNILMKHLSGLGLDWDIYCKPAMLVYNSYASTNLADFSPFELVFGRKANICPELEIKPQIPITGTHKQAFELLQKRLLYFRQALQKFRETRQSLLNRDKTYHGYTAGQIVYLYFPGKTAMLHTGSQKIRCNFIGPLAIWKCVSPTQFILMSLDGKLYPYLIEENRIKPGIIRTTKGNVNTMSHLRQIVRSGHLLDLEN